MTSYEDIADLPYAPSESDLKDPDYFVQAEPSLEWDVENFAAARSEAATACNAFGIGCGGTIGPFGTCSTCGALA